MTPTQDPQQVAAECIRKLSRVEESPKEYTKAAEGGRDKKIFRGPLNDQGDLRPMSFDRLLFLNMFKTVADHFFGTRLS